MNRTQTVTSVRVHGPVLRLVREARGITCSQLARRAGVSPTFLSAVERGKKCGVRLAVFRVLVVELGVRDARVLMIDPYGPDVTQVIGSIPVQSGPTLVLSEVGEVTPTRAA